MDVQLVQGVVGDLEVIRSFGGAAAVSRVLDHPHVRYGLSLTSFSAMVTKIDS